MTEVGIRPAALADAERAYLILETCRLGPWYELTWEQFRGWWPTYDGIWVGEEEENAVAFGAARGASIEVYVLPHARRRGIGTRLLRAAEAAVATRPLEATSRRDEPAAAPFLTRHGYERRLEVWAMERELDGDLGEPRWPPGMVVRTFRDDDASAVKELVDAAYAAEPFFTPVPFDEWKRSMLGDESFDAESWFLVEAPGGGLAAAALNWREGYVKDLVVHPEHRRRGLGRALLHHTFRHFAGRGVERVALKTDSGNTSRARRLYERVGMRVVRTYDEWEKRARGDGEDAARRVQR